MARKRKRNGDPWCRNNVNKQIRRVRLIFEERRTVVLMQRLRADGWSDVCIAAELDRRAIKARCRRKWNWSSVRAALRNTMRETEAAST